MRTLALIWLLALLLGLSACNNPDAPFPRRISPTGGSPPGNAGEPPAPAPPLPGSQAPTAVQPTPQRALDAFASLYVNWTYRTLSSVQGRLAEISVARARLGERQAQAASRGDTALSRGEIFNRGQVVAISQRLGGGATWVVVTSEQTGGDSEYEGSLTTLHVTFAQVASVPGGFAVSQWLPQT